MSGLLRSPVTWITLATIACAALVFGPSLPLFDVSFLGVEYVDHFGTQWFYWFAEYTLRTGTSPAHTDLFFYPWGKDIYGHTGANVLDAYLAMPFRVLLGHVAGYNAFVIAGLAFNGLCFYKLAREFTDDPVAAGVGALLFTFTPYALYEAAEGRPTQAILGAPCMFLLYVWRTGLRRGLRAPLLGGLWLAVCGYQYWYYAFFGGMACLVHGLWRAALPPGEDRSPEVRARILARYALMAVAAAALVAPAAIPALQASQSGEVPGLLDVANWTFGSTPPITIDGTEIGLYLWQPWLGQSGFYVTTKSAEEMFLSHHRVLTQPMLVATVLYLIRPGRMERGPWLAMTLVCALLAAGPMIIVTDRYLPNPLYIGLVKQLGFLQRLWWPGRTFSFLSILLGLAAVSALAWAGRRRLLQILLSVGLIGGSMMSLIGLKLAPFPNWDATIPAGYECMAGGPPGAMIELPYHWTQAHLYYQVAHGRPILGGMIEDNPVFTPDAFVEFRTKNTYVETVLAAARLSEPDAPWTEADRQEVYDLGYRYVLLQKDAYGTEVLDASLVNNARKTRLRRSRAELRRLIGEPIYEDSRVIIYAPWGDPLPCADDPDFAPDTGPPIRNKKQGHLRAPVSQYDREIFPLIFRPDVDLEEPVDRTPLGEPSEARTPLSGPAEE